MTERITDERLASLFKDAEQCGIFPAVKVNPRELSSVLAELAEFRDREAGSKAALANLTAEAKLDAVCDVLAPPIPLGVGLIREMDKRLARVLTILDGQTDESH